MCESGHPKHWIYNPESPWYQALTREASDGSDGSDGRDSGGSDGNGGSVGEGKCVVVDIDGVIADGSHRQYLLQQDPPRWKTFFLHSDSDEPIAGSKALLESFNPQWVVVLLTARPHYVAERTRIWLDEKGFRWDLLITRARSDGGLKSPEFKKRSIAELETAGLATQLAIDDDARNISAFEQIGLEALYLHSGYYD